MTQPTNRKDIIWAWILGFTISFLGLFIFMQSKDMVTIICVVLVVGYLLRKPLGRMIVNLLFFISKWSHQILDMTGHIGKNSSSATTYYFKWPKHKEPINKSDIN